MGLFRSVAALLFIVAVPVALLTTSIRIVLNEPRVYEYATDHYDTPVTTGIARSELLQASAELRAYFNRSGDEPLFIRVQQDGQPVSLFNQRETAHMQDVKTLFRATFRIQEAAVVFVLAYVVGVFIWAREGTLRTLARQLLLSALAGVAVMGVAGLVAIAGFDAFWERFHIIAFSNDLWQLDPSRDRLIQMFPEAFWQDVSLWIGIGTLVELVVLGLGAAMYIGLTREDPMTYDATLAHGARA